ncbi:MAG: hypothetical protein J1F20_04345 [Muribaculaceae bacterium]|nr:hypothetical protein [Muribaculaceae bacterium]
MKLKLLVCTTALGLLTVSCFDDKYDLSDIDTTTRIAVNDLVIPVNIGEVLLSDVIKLDDDSDIKVGTFVPGSPDGEWYYIDREGDFSSDPIFIASPAFKAPSLSSKSATLVAINGTFPIPQLGNDFTLTCNTVDNSLVALDKMYLSGLDFTITLNTLGLTEGEYHNMKIQLPKGLGGNASVGSYDSESGIWSISSLTIVNGVATATLSTNALDLTVNDFTYNNPTLSLSSSFGIVDGSITVTNSAGNQVTLSVDFKLSDFSVVAFDGTIKYEINGMDVESVSLASLPDFLKGDETNLTLANPMICLQTNNPLASDNLEFTAGLTLTAQRNGEDDASYSSSMFTVGYGSSDGWYNTILSPEQPTYVPEKFANHTWFAYTSLRDVLSGAGIPNAIGIHIDDPKIPQQQVKGFELGRNIEGVAGSYQLFAPLALGVGSKIVYTDTKTGWNEDVEDLTIETLTLTALATNNTPLSAQLTVYPLDVNGERIQGVTVTSNELASGKQDSELIFTLSGQIKNLDGVEFVATVVAADSKPLSAKQSISLKNIRAKVNGYYTKEL